MKCSIRRFLLRAFRRDSSNYKYASGRIKNNRKYVLIVLSANGGLLEFVPEIFQDDRECVMIAITDNSLEAFRFASTRLRDDKEIAQLAMEKYGMVNYKHLSPRLQNDPQLITMKENFVFDDCNMGCQ